MKAITMAVAPVDPASVEGLPPGPSNTAMLDEQNGIANIYFRAPDTGRGYVLTVDAAQLAAAPAPEPPQSAADAAAANVDALRAAERRAAGEAEAERLQREAEAAAAAEDDAGVDPEAAAST